MYYADTSALVKLVVSEPETPALRQWIARSSAELACSDLVRTELLRAVRRAAPTELTQARDVLARLTLLAATPVVFDAAARLDPAELRSLDAVHLASALALGDDLDGVLTYDERLAAATRHLGLRVLSPA